MKITAPWSPAQVDALNKLQRRGNFHGYTCAESHTPFDRTLVATKGGWICPHCDYRQDWAHFGLAGAVPAVSGWAVIDGVEILVRTVMDTRRAAIVNYLVVHREIQVKQSWTDADIETAWAVHCGEARVVPVNIEAVQ